MNPHRILLACPVCEESVPVDVHVSVRSKVLRAAGFFDDARPRVTLDLDLTPDMSEIYAHVWKHEAR